MKKNMYIFFYKNICIITYTIYSIFFKNIFIMSKHIICDYIIRYNKAIFLDYDNSYYSIITFENGKFKCNKYDNNILVEDKYISEDEIIKLISKYKIAYINNIEYKLNSGKINSFVG